MSWSLCSFPKNSCQKRKIYLSNTNVKCEEKKKGMCPSFHWNFIAKLQLRSSNCALLHEYGDSSASPLLQGAYWVQQLRVLCGPHLRGGVPGFGNGHLGQWGCGWGFSQMRVWVGRWDGACLIHAQSSQLLETPLLDHPMALLPGNLSVFLHMQVNVTLYSAFPVVAV